MDSDSRESLDRALGPQSWGWPWLWSAGRGGEHGTAAEGLAGPASWAPGPRHPACQVRGSWGLGPGARDSQAATSPPAVSRAGFDGEDDKRSENSIGPCNQGQR